MEGGLLYWPQGCHLFTFMIESQAESFPYQGSSPGHPHCGRDRNLVSPRSLARPGRRLFEVEAITKAG